MAEPVEEKYCIFCEKKLNPYQDSVHCGSEVCKEKMNKLRLLRKDPKWNGIINGYFFQCTEAVIF